MKKIRAIKRPSVGEQICAQIKESLFDGTWKPGDRLPSEQELAESFGVSRVSIREALLRLTSLGLLETRFGSGSYVKKITPGIHLTHIVPVAYLETSSILEVIEYRQVVEIKTAGLAARRAAADDIASLEDILERMDKYKLNRTRFADEDLNFHLELAKITKNSLLIETLNIIRSILSQAMYQAIMQRGHTQGLVCHRHLIDAIAAHDEKTAMRIMEEHIDDVYQTMERCFGPRVL